MFVRLRLTIRTRLALLYGALVALTTVIFAVIAYYTVSSELYQSLDASLSRAGSSLLSVIKKEQQQVQRPLAPVKRGKRGKPTDMFEFLRRSSMRDFVGPIPIPDSVSEAVEDPVWTAVYEHVLLNSSTYVLQVRNNENNIVWRSDNMITDSLPDFAWFAARRTPVYDDKIITYYTLGGVRYRLVVTKGDIAEVAAAYPVAEINSTLTNLFSMMLYSIPFVIALSVIVGWILARRSLKPVDTLTKMARRITAERLSERLPVSDSNDEIARLSATLNEMIARLEHSFEHIKQFTGDASHELKTPLAILMGELEIALRKPIADENIRATLESCLEEVDRLSVVVQGLLDISRTDSGQAILENDPVDISALVADICEDMSILAEPRGVRVESEIQSNLFTLGDSIRLHQACLNVIENAVKYTMSGGLVSVTVSSPDEEFVTIAVTDTGVGIPSDQLPHIYDRFFRVDKARSQSIPGTGLGLSIVRWIVEAHRGTIQAYSEEGKGSTFVITLPRS